MIDAEFLIETATKAADSLGMPLGDIEPVRMLEMYSCLHILLGGDKELMIHWLNTYNKHLGYCPGDHLTDARMVDTLRYLEAMVEN